MYKIKTVTREKKQRLYGGNDSDVYLLKRKRGKFVLKVYRFFNLKDILAEIKAMKFLAHYGLPVPNPLKMTNEKFYFFYKDRPAIIYPYLEGGALEKTQITPQTCFQVGELIAWIDLKLKKLELPLIKNRKIIWDLMQFGENEHLIKYLSFKHSGLKDDVKTVFIQYKKIKTILNNLPRQLILNDISETNLLTENKKISGLVDFSDMVYAPKICNLAVTASHLCFDSPSWNNKLKQLIRGYKKNNKLSLKELNLLPVLIRMRTVMLILGNYHQQKTRKNSGSCEKAINKNVGRLKLLNTIPNEIILKTGL